MAQAKKSKKTKAAAKPKAKTKPAAKIVKMSTKPYKAAKSQQPGKLKKTTKSHNSAKSTKQAKSVAKTKVAVSTKSTNKKSGKWSTFITPLDDRLIVKIEMQSEKTAGGLYIPSTVISERPSRGVVLAAGRGHSNKKGRIKPMDVKVGDEVLFNAMAGTEMKIEGQDVMILREADLLGIVD